MTKNTHKLLDFSASSPTLMGVLNTTPDSFSDGGMFLKLEDALAQGRKLLDDGAHLLDIGGESTGPGASDVSSKVELQRVLPVIEALAQEAFISVDTFRATTADTALQKGAQMINDVSALRADNDMRSVIANHGSYVVLMFSKEEDGKPHASIECAQYPDVIQTIVSFLKRRIDYALAGGIAEDKIIIDPGMGMFISSEAQYSWEVLGRLREITEAFPRYPLLIGTSRKGFLGGELASRDPHSRDPLSQLTALRAWEQGAAIIRTHNVAMATSFVQTWQRMQ